MSQERLREETINFAAGPAQLPYEVLTEAQKGLLNYNGHGMSILEITHRSPMFDQLNQETNDLIRTLLNVPDNYKILFLQGGGTGQFAAVPLNLTSSNEDVVDYIVTGQWSGKAAKEAEKYAKVNLVLPKQDKYTYIPEPVQWSFSDKPRYVYYCANETVHGVEWPEIPAVGETLLVCDASSNFLTRSMDVSSHALVYAGVQKNVGCAGLTVVIVREDLLGSVRKDCPIIWDYTTQTKMKSAYNTPNVWGIYILNLVLKWLQDNGGLEAMETNSAAKSGILFDMIGRSEGFYSLIVEPKYRSRVNIPFRVCKDDSPNDELEAMFLKESAERGLLNLKGYRLVGGIRASLYNAVSVMDTKKLADFMRWFYEEYKLRN
ncbi:phosphoserine aminotransferase-like [Halichondria panicea]|uniref:phosphoserine aminotransferase-like n=1 Tax=Halichondria panicea TaxID=6063 RepID=UPI00312B8954